MPTAPETFVRFPQLGIDGSFADSPEPRLITFRTDGPGTITATLSSVSAGRIRMCLGRGEAANVSERECQTSRDGSMTRVVPDSGAQRWTLSLVGAEGSSSPSAALELRFRTDQPEITLGGFRFQGTSNVGYNGIDVELEVSGDGRLGIDAQWTGGSLPFRLRIDDIDGGSNVDEVTGNDQEIHYDTELGGASTYHVIVDNEQEFAEVESFLSGTISWP